MELTAPVDLCLADGSLNPAARGWARRPLFRCNLNGPWPRQKRWNYWCITDGRLLFSATLSHIDYLGLAFVYLYDRETGFFREQTWVRPLGQGCGLPDVVEASIAFKARGLSLLVEHHPGGYRLVVDCPKWPLYAQLDIEVPQGHDTLNVVVPWSDRRFQMTSKQNTLPTKGEVWWGDERHAVDGFATLDFGRGVWPYRCTWNWASFSTVQDGRRVGLNLGGQWTDGTGANENALCVDGDLTRLEDVVFHPERGDWMKPWRIVGPEVDLLFTPDFDRVASIDLGVLSSTVHQCLGTFAGEVAGVAVTDAFGWSEEHVARW